MELLLPAAVITLVAACCCCCLRGTFYIDFKHFVEEFRKKMGKTVNIT